MSDTSDHSSVPRAHLLDRIGIVTRLLIGSLLVLVVTVGSVQLWMLRTIEAFEVERVQESLGVSMTLLRHELSRLGTVWGVTAEGGLVLGSTALNGRNDLVDVVTNVTTAVATIFQGDTRIATSVRQADGSRGTGTKLAAGAAYDAVLRDGRAYQGTATILGRPHITVYEPIQDAHAKTIGILFVGVPIADVEALLGRLQHQALIGTLCITLLASLAYLWLLRHAVQPVTRLAVVMRHVAGGALDSAVPFARRRDQIGDMARALLLLRDASARARALEEVAAEERDSAAREKRVAMDDMAETIERQTTAAVQQVGGRTTAMAATAEEMRASAEQTNSSAENATSASERVLANARTVASAADQLSASIREIAVRVAQSTEIVGHAVAAGDEARTTISALNEEVARIGVAADMIGEIAAKTNLLALNATIESARAGEAGKGFAVVASEVKSLAGQTARSTQEIAQHIAQVRGATEASVAAVARIEETIGQVNAIAGSIAAAIEEQQVATTEIARNVAETASAATAMCGLTAEVSAAADRTGRHADHVRETAAHLDAAINELRNSVTHVVRSSAAA